MLFLALTILTVNVNAVTYIESKNNPQAYAIKENARGLGQIRPIVLQEYNKYNKTTVRPCDLFLGAINLKICDWYLNKRIPAMLRAYRLADTIENRLICYNAGIGKLRSGAIPSRTIAYIKEYNRLTKKGVPK